MPSANINDVLGAPQLCGTIQATKSGIPDVLPPGLYEVDKTVEKDYGEYKRVLGSREVAKLAAYGSPSQTAQLRGVEAVPVKLLHTIENINLPIADYLSITTPDALAIDEYGVQEVARQVGEFRRRFDNLRVMAATSVLFQGNIWSDGQGNLLPSSTGARSIANFAVPTTHQGQLPVIPNGSGGFNNILTTSWDNTAAPIDAMVRLLNEWAMRETGYPVGYALYGKNVPTYLTTNAALQPYFIRNASANEQFLATSEIPNPLLGLKWLPAYTSFWLDQNGNYQSVVGDDQVVFIPEPSVEWWGWIEGKYPIPTNLGTVASDGVSLLSGQILKKAGMFAYALLTADPVAAKMVAGDTFLPVLKVPKAIWQATVKF